MTTYARHYNGKHNPRPAITVDHALKERTASRKQYLTRQPSTTYTREMAWAKARTAQAFTRAAMANEAHATLWLTYSFTMPADIAAQHIAMFGGVHPFGLKPLPRGQGDLSWLEFVDPPKTDDDEETVPLEDLPPRN